MQTESTRKPMSKREKRVRQRLKDDFPHFAERCLRIKDKLGSLDDDGGLRRLVLNDPQAYLHACIEKQLREKGMVRILILKGRQQGCSTYVEGRFYWKVSHRKGVNAFILTHEDKATTNLFDMASTYHENCPALVRPNTSAANAKELFFDKLNSGYGVGTAKTKGTGRSSTIQFFHGSEVAYWPNAETHMAGVLQAVPLAPGTEVILESTSAGPQGLFYEMCMAAQKGEGDYQLIFIPWFWSKEYRKDPGPDFEPTSEEARYAEEFKLDLAQIAWRRAKISELRGVDAFRREYPATVEEAFKASAKHAIWTQELIKACQVAALPEDSDGEPLPFVKFGVALDPSGGKGPKNDEVGIVAGGLCSDGNVYLTLDASGKMSPAEWGNKSVVIYDKNKADAVIGESNFGGEMVETVVKQCALLARKHVTYRAVHASRGKAIRAEPVKVLYEQGRVKHVGHLIALEDEMVTWEPGLSNWSPNRMDAAVWLVTWLLIEAGTGVVVSTFS